MEDGVVNPTSDQESDVVTAGNSRRASQAICGSSGVAHSSTVDQGIHQQKQRTTQTCECNPVVVTQPFHPQPPSQIDCIKISVLENSPMASRFLLNRSRVREGQAEMPVFLSDNAVTCSASGHLVTATLQNSSNDQEVTDTAVAAAGII